MPQKAIFTQCSVVLLREAVTLDDIERLLATFHVLRRIDEGAEEWALAGPSLLLRYRPELNGIVQVDTVPQPWPDAMGDPQDAPMIFAAWAMGHFGPLTWPSALKSACDQSWGWPDGQSLPQTHKAFIRIRCSYALGEVAKDAPVIPDGVNAVHEMEYMTRVVTALLGLPKALCYFNPGGQLVLNLEDVEGKRAWAAENKLQPLDVWTNVRMFRFDEKDASWMLMDTLGMGQIDTADHEAIFARGSAEAGQVAAFLRNMSSYVHERGPVIADGNTADGAGHRWQAQTVKEGRVDPPREVIRWTIVGAKSAPQNVLSR